MCLVVLAWKVPDRGRLVLVGHRDEFHARATAAMDWWPAPPVLAGRDLAAGGTWLGVDRLGRFGVVTNRRGVPGPPEPPSRGTLIPGFLGARVPAGEFITALAAEAHRYAGFSLLLGDESELWYLSNGDACGPRRLAAGVYGLSNGALDADWPKVRRSRARLAARIARPLGPAAELFGLLDDREPAPDAQLPDTGIGLELERRLSPPFILGADYGTRCATAIVLAAGGGGEVVERSHAADGRPTGTRAFEL
ncbi:MAG TPA: NRDE family protein [Steroidobacteraceae bacterium]|nr:NRDE family protein [Steroidobacteraceae bacterium]